MASVFTPEDDLVKRAITCVESKILRDQQERRTRLEEQLIRKQDLELRNELKKKRDAIVQALPRRMRQRVQAKDSEKVAVPSSDTGSMRGISLHTRHNKSRAYVH